jgi:glycosyltransferase involved in cell wall biosynthesis
LKVLHLINNLNREGAQVVVFNLATATGESTVQHIVCAREPGGALQADLEAHGVPVYAPDRYHGARETRRSLQFLERILQEQSIDLVHAHMADAAFLGWRLARKHALPLIITHHGHDLLPRCGRLCRLVYLLVLAAAAHYSAQNVAISPVVAKNLRRWLLLPRTRVRVLTNGVPVPMREQCVRPMPQNRAPHVIAVGRLVGLKGHDQLVAAAALLTETFPGIRFSLVGDGPLRETLARQADSLGVAERVVFTGSVDDVPARLQAADLYVSTSHYEGMPMATLEAMAWCVPVVASDVPGNRAVVRDGETGLLYALGDIRGLAGRIKETLTEPGQAATRALNARRLVETQYSAAAVAGGYARLYADVLETHHARARAGLERT